MNIRALIVDDEPLAREWVRSAVAEDPELEVLGECGNGFEAAETIRRLNGDDREAMLRWIAGLAPAATQR